MKIAIAGYGVEGEANYHYWSKDPVNEITIVDEAEQPKSPLPEGVPTILGEDAFKKLEGFDLVVRSAGLAPYKIKTNGKIWSATNEFFEKCPAPTIGVTGTKGKGTTSSMIASILEAAGKKTWLVGNIGTAALEHLDQMTAEDVVVFEMSSFQLWDIERSPNVAVVLPIEPDHLNVHSDMEDYVRAKGGIRRYQKEGDICVYHSLNEYARLIALSNPGVPMMRYGIETDGGVYVKNGCFYIREQVICSTEVLQVPGHHNIENASAAITAVKQIGISNEAIAQGLQNFEGLPHRIEHVRELDGVDYYNDSFSSAPSATVAAINSFSRPEILILGGVDKGADFSELADAINAHQNVKHIIIIGEIREKLHDILLEKGVVTQMTMLDAQTMAEIISHVRRLALPGDVVLLSPSCASFDMFKDFYDRGDQFRAIVAAL